MKHPAGNAGLMLIRHRRQRTDIEPALVDRLVFVRGGGGAP